MDKQEIDVPVGDKGHQGQEESINKPNMGTGHCKICGCQAYAFFGIDPNKCARDSCQHSINDHK